METDSTPTPQSRIPTNIADEMRQSYMDYAMSVIIGRALPDVRDGLKPANRRVLYGMQQMGLQPGRPYRKCAKIVGEVMGNYHPHGDQAIYDALVRANADRASTLVTFGGGVIGDMAGFAAASYQRGVPFIQVPTTLLAQVDSSVGGKTGVNHPLGKNMIGAFYQPRAVIIDTDTLNTLPGRELSSGLAEVIKYGLIRDPEFFTWLEVNLDKLLARDPEALAYAIHRSCRNKAEVVAADERESGVRATLNLGHSFGHAIETGVGYGNWLHGEAIAAGMVMASDLSRRLTWLSAADVARVEKLIRRARLPVRAPGTLSTARFLELMAVDKKVLDGRLRLVLLKRLGEAVVTDDYPRAELEATLASMREAA